MKKRILFIILCILGILYLQFGQSPTLIHTTTTSNAQGYEAILTVTANKLLILNQEKMADNLVQHAIENDFEPLQLSYDLLGYPNELTITVYANALTEYFDIPAFHISYAQETPYQYTIDENPDAFTTSIWK